MSIRFRVSCRKNRRVEDDGHLDAAVSLVRKALDGLSYFGEMRSSNSKQVDTTFDKELTESLEKNGVDVERRPEVSFDDRKLEGDLLLSCKDSCRVAVEVEKTNKKTLWIDFMKLWWLIDSEKAHCGIIVCPVNYAHSSGVWDLFKEAADVALYLEKAAKVPKDRMSLIGVVGYTQEIYVNGTWHVLDSNRLKQAKGAVGE